MALSDGTVVNLNSESELKYPVLFTGVFALSGLAAKPILKWLKMRQHPFYSRNCGSKDQGIGTGFNVMAYPGDAESA